MKRWFWIPVLAVCLTGCGAQQSAEQPTAEQPAGETTEERTPTGYTVNVQLPPGAQTPEQFVDTLTLSNEIVLEDKAPKQQVIGTLDDAGMQALEAYFDVIAQSKSPDTENIPDATEQTKIEIQQGEQTVAELVVIHDLSQYAETMNLQADQLSNQNFEYRILQSAQGVQSPQDFIAGLALTDTVTVADNEQETITLATLNEAEQAKVDDYIRTLLGTYDGASLRDAGISSTLSINLVDGEVQLTVISDLQEWLDLHGSDWKSDGLTHQNFSYSIEKT